MTTPLVSRAGAGLRPPNGGYSTAFNPEGLTVHYGGPSPWPNHTFNHDRCASVWRAWQAYHMDNNGWTDVAYHGAVCPHGTRYEGRPRNARSAAQGTNDGNLRSPAIVYLAGQGDAVTNEALVAFLDWSAWWQLPLRWVHQDWHSTDCPGSVLVEWKNRGFPHPVGGVTVVAHPDPTLPPEDDVLTKEQERALFNIDVHSDEISRKLTDVTQALKDLTAAVNASRK